MQSAPELLVPLFKTSFKNKFKRKNKKYENCLDNTDNSKEINTLSEVNHFNKIKFKKNPKACSHLFVISLSLLIA